MRYEVFTVSLVAFSTAPDGVYVAGAWLLVPVIGKGLFVAGYYLSVALQWRFSCFIAGRHAGSVSPGAVAGLDGCRFAVGRE